MIVLINIFKKDFQQNLEKNILLLKKFSQTFQNKRDFLKKNVARANDAPYITKILRSGRSLFQEKNSRFIIKVEKKRITVAGFTNKSKKNILKVLIQ